MNSQIDAWQQELYQAQKRQRNLPVFSPRIDGESLSSWIVRLADGLGMSASEFGFWLVGRGRQLFGEDVDRGAWQELMAVLSTAARQPLADLNLGTLKIYEGLLWGELAKNGRARWVLPINKRGTNWSGYGIQYCPSCLASDAIPHIRLIWRLSFIVCCPVHHCMLSDRCWRCGAPVIPQRWRTGRLRVTGTSGILYCHACEADRREIPNAGCVRESLEQAQASMAATLEQGMSIQGERQIHSLAYFSGAAGIWSMLDNVSYVDVLWKSLDVEQPDFGGTTRQRYGGFERHNVEYRAALLEGYFALMREGIQGLVQKLKRGGYTSSHLLNCFSLVRTPVPYWVWAPVHAALNKISYVPSDQEIQHAIFYQMRKESAQYVRIRDVCQLLGMATLHSARVANAMRKLGAVNQGRTRLKSTC